MRFQVKFFFRENIAVHNLSNIQEVKTLTFDLKSNSKKKNANNISQDKEVQSRLRPCPS